MHIKTAADKPPLISHDLLGLFDLEFMPIGHVTFAVHILPDYHEIIFAQFDRPAVFQPPIPDHVQRRNPLAVY